MAQNDHNNESTVGGQIDSPTQQAQKCVSHPSTPEGGVGQSSMVMAKVSLRRIREASLRNKDLEFHSLHHHLSIGLLAMAFELLNSMATPGVDRITKEEYRKNLAKNLRGLRYRLVNGTYEFTPVRRTYIPKPDGGRRPLGICIIEDKIVQGALKLLLDAVYDVHFAGFSYGFRPKTRQHDALDALHEAICTRPVNYILDADITKCFDTINHDVLFEVLKLRIKDKPILRLIRMMIKSGVLEGNQWLETPEGVTQGSVISPLLANIFLSYVIDEFYMYWRNNMNASGGFSCMVRYADDFILGFEYKEQAEHFLAILKDRLLCAGLRLHKDKTRLIRFGKTARRDNDDNRPETFNFLGFVHSCGVTWKARRFKLLRRCIASRLNAKAKSISEKLRETILAGTPIEEMLKHLNRRLQGYYNYYAVHDNLSALCKLRYLVSQSVFKLLNRRSQKRSFTWESFNKHVQPMIIIPKVSHAYPSLRMADRWKLLFNIRHSTKLYE